MKRHEYGILLLLFMTVALLFRFGMLNRNIVPENRITAYFPRQGDETEKALLSLFSKAKAGGYLYVAIYSFTNERVCQALIDAKRRGVDVRVITDRINACESGQRKFWILSRNLRSGLKPTRMIITTIPACIRRQASSTIGSSPPGAA